MSVTNEVLNKLYTVKQFERLKPKARELIQAIEQDNVIKVDEIFGEVFEEVSNTIKEVGK